METKREAIETRIPKGRTLRIQDGRGLDLDVVTGCLGSEALHGFLHRTAAWIGGGAADEHQPACRYGVARHPRAV